MPRFAKASFLTLFVIGTIGLKSGLSAAAPQNGVAQRSESGMVREASNSPQTRGVIAANYGKLPLSFEANRGQTDKRVSFTARGQGYGLYLSGQEAVLALHNPQAWTVHPNVGQQRTQSGPPRANTDVLRMQLRGANANARPTGIDPLPGTANYIIGNDASKWHTAIPTYSRVKFSGVYPGVDVIYYGNQSQLEYDFLVAANADPKVLRLHFVGATALALSDDGDLSVSAKNGQIAFHKPIVYQEKNGQRQTVEGHFKLLARNSVGFSLSSYDHSRPLVIDPVLAYSTYIDQGGVGIAVDGSGNTYIAGTTGGGLPVTRGAILRADINSTGETGFVLKLNSTGTAPVYSTYLGGTGAFVYSHLNEDWSGDRVSAVAADSAGDAYICGATGSGDFPWVNGSPQGGNPNSDQITGFLTEINPSGTGLIYSQYIGMGIPDSGLLGASSVDGCAVNASGDTFIFGTTLGGVNASGVGPGGEESDNYVAFVMELDATGNELYGTYVGPTEPSAVAIDGFGGGAYTLGGVVTKSDRTGTILFSAPISGNTIAEDALGNTYISGGGSVSRLNSVGALSYSITPPGSSNSFAADSLGDLYVVGVPDSNNFPLTPGAIQTTDTGGFLSKYDPSGSNLLYSTFLQGVPSGVAVDSVGNAYVTGRGYVTATPWAYRMFGAYFVSKLNLAQSAPQPEFSPAAGKYIGELSVTIIDNTLNATVYYTLDGSNPDTSSAVYSVPIRVTAYTTVKAMSVAAGYVPSPIVESSYTVISQTPSPIISPAGGSYPVGQPITIVDPDPTATIRYTTDGSVPNTHSNWYHGPLILNSSETIKAIAISTDDATSNAVSATYLVP